MRKLVRSVAWTGLGLCVLLGPSGCPINAVFFSDDALESVVRSALGKPFGFLHEGELLDITELDATGMGVTDLRGLEYCRSLVKLNLRSNKVRSLTPLRELTGLTNLDVGDNLVVDISSLSGLFALEQLTLWGTNNDITDYRPLVANAQAGGLSAGDQVILGTEWTLNDDGTIRTEFQDDYTALRNEDVEVLFAQADGTTIQF